MTVFHRSEMTHDELTQAVNLSESCEITQAEMDEMTEQEYAFFLANCPSGGK